MHLTHRDRQKPPQIIDNKKKKKRKKLEVLISRTGLLKLLVIKWKI